MKKKINKIALFCDDSFGIKVLKHIKSKKINLDLIVYNYLNKQIRNDIKKEYKDSLIIGSNKIALKKNIQMIKKLNIDIIILAWWPYIIKQPFLSLANKYIVNMHPSFLPFGKGKHPYFWSIVENTKFGVSLHLVNDGIDSGKIIARDSIDINWEDNGYTLREKSRLKLFLLFKKNFSKIINDKITFINNSPNKRIHYSSELEEKSRIKLNKNYRAKKFIDLIRAHSGFKEGGCWFIDKNIKYHITTKIVKLKKEKNEH
jgi:methionyl-tRNA formyltransferase